MSKKKTETNEGPAVYCRYTEMRSPAVLVEHPRNPNVHPESQLKLLADVIRGNGWRQPVTVSDLSGYIIKGHGRYQAAKLAGFPEVPVEVQHYENEVAEMADMLADNRIAELSNMDTAQLIDALKDIPDDVMALTGYTDEDLKAMLHEVEDVQDVQEDEVKDEVPPVTQPGDLWILGEHRLLCGDSSDAECIKGIKGEDRPELLFTDPPYGIGRDKGFSGERAFGGKKGGKKIKARTYEGNWDSATPDKETFSLILQSAGKAIIWGGNFFTDKLPQGNFWIVWDKHNSMPTFGDCELAWTNIARNSVKKYDVLYNGLIGKEKERFHPTQKPVKLCADVISDFTEVGDIVLDTFAGSGTTLAACQQLGRKARLIELDPHYCDVIVQRFRDLVPGGEVRLIRGGAEVENPFSE